MTSSAGHVSPKGRVQHGAEDYRRDVHRRHRRHALVGAGGRPRHAPRAVGRRAERGADKGRRGGRRLPPAHPRHLHRVLQGDVIMHSEHNVIMHY